MVSILQAGETILSTKTYFCSTKTYFRPKLIFGIRSESESDFSIVCLQTTISVLFPCAEGNINRSVSAAHQSPISTHFKMGLKLFSVSTACPLVSLLIHLFVTPVFCSTALRPGGAPGNDKEEIEMMELQMAAQDSSLKRLGKEMGELEAEISGIFSIRSCAVTSIAGMDFL